jgi:hypothetical protein
MPVNGDVTPEPSNTGSPKIESPNTSKGVVGVIAHIENPTFDTVRRLARTAEAAGADWLGVADASWCG